MVTENIKRTIESLEENIKRNPDNAQLVLSLAEAYVSAQIFNDKAQSIFEQAVEIKPDATHLQEALSITYLVKFPHDFISQSTTPRPISEKALRKNIDTLRGFMNRYPRSVEVMRALGDFQLLAHRAAPAKAYYMRAKDHGLNEFEPIIKMFDYMEPFLAYGPDELVFFSNLALQVQDFTRSYEMCGKLIFEVGYLTQEILNGFKLALTDLTLNCTEPGRRARYQLEYVFILFINGNHSEAIDYFHQINFSLLADTNLIKRLTRFCIDMDDYRQAFDLISHIPLDYEAKKLLNEITICLEERGELDTAIYLLKYINEHDLLITEAESQRKKEIDINTATELADLHFRNRRFPQSLEKFIEVLSLDPPDWTHIVNRINYLIDRNTSLSPSHLCFLGTFFTKKNRYRQAEFYLKKAIDLDPNYHPVRKALRDLYAIQLTEMVNIPKVRIALGDLSVVEGDLDLAMNQYKEAEKFPETSLLAHTKMAHVAMLRGNYIMAFSKFANLPILEVQQMDTLYELHERLFEAGHIKEAFDALMKINESDPEYRDVDEKIIQVKKHLDEVKVSGTLDTRMMDIIGDNARGKYKYLEKLGGGGMGVVYHVIDIKNDREVALKVLREGLTSSSKAMERFFREARIAAMLRHKNIVDIYDYNISADSGKSYISMEYINGPSLRSIMEERLDADKPVDNEYVTEMLYYLIQLCDALDATHKKGIIHRDIKPDNIMINSQKVVKVTDFGIVHVEEASFTPTGAMIGTPRYMSPEQVRGSRIDGRSDLYSVGIVLYEMLVGSPPFISGDIAYQQVNELPTRPREISREIPKIVEDIIMTTLNKKPDDRYQNGDELKAVFQKALYELGGHEPVLEEETGTSGGVREKFDSDVDMFDSSPDA